MAGETVSLLRVLLTTAVPVNTLTGVQTAPEVSSGSLFNAKLSLPRLMPGMSVSYCVKSRYQSKVLVAFKMALSTKTF